MPYWVAAIPLATPELGLRCAIVVEVGDTPGWTLDVAPGDRIFYQVGMFGTSGYEIDGYVYVNIATVVGFESAPT